MLGVARDWLVGIPEDIREKINQRTTFLKNGHRYGTGNWWIWRQPSTGLARDVDLILKNDAGREVSREAVMRSGKPVGKWAS